MGKTVLSEQTALSALLALRRRWGWFRPAIFTADCGCPSQAQVDFITSHDDFDAGRVHVLIAKQSNVRRRPHIVQSVYSGAKHGIVVRADEWDPYFMPSDILICSPSFLLAQLAGKWSFYDLFNLALQFGGTYTIDDSTGELLSDREPFLTKLQLSKMADRLSYRRWLGIDNFRNVAKYFIEGSASPMESNLYAKFALPTSMGGFGVSGLELNKQVDLSSRAVKIAGQTKIIVDFLHKKSKVVIEYDSRDFHSSVDQSQRDKQRRDALQCDGYKCFSIVTRQITDRDIFNECAYPIVKAIKGRCRIRNKSFDFQQRQLFNALKHWQF